MSMKAIAVAPIVLCTAAGLAQSRPQALAPGKAEAPTRVIVPTPLEAGEMAPNFPALHLSLNDGALDAWRGIESGVIVGFPVGEGRTVDLDLHRVDAFMPDAQLILVDENGEHAMPRPDVTILSGTIVGDPSSLVVLGLSPHGSNGFIQEGGVRGQRYMIASRPAGGPEDAIVYNATDMQFERAGPACAERTPVAPGFATWKASRPQTPAGTAPRLGAPCRVASIAVETDYEYSAEIFGGDTNASAAYATFLIIAGGEITKRDLNVSQRIAFLRVFATNNDPYLPQGPSDVFERLFEMQDYWNANMTGVQRSSVHMLTGLIDGTGGVAYVGGLCATEYDYASSGYLNGGFPYPIVSYDSGNWDLVVTTHEQGHLYGSPHTHDTFPPIDNCGNGDCSNAFGGTIMSYCHTCPGGIANIDIRYHGRNINEDILPFLDTLSCGLEPTAPSITTPPQGGTFCDGATAELSVVASGVDLEYQWTRNNVDIVGANDSTYTFAVTGATAGTYRVRVSNACESTTSSPASVSVTTPCDADCDGNCAVNSSDFLCFLNQFDSRDPSADLTNDGEFDSSDFLAYLNRYSGCVD
ncbi:MAG: M12 family metallo-peptidase [Phycisphaerales bacterium]|jgi:hypothetical protein|nr:M12 family metallo-peptidase [Phycisphaerales bacterium]